MRGSDWRPIATVDIYPTFVALIGRFAILYGFMFTENVSFCQARHFIQSKCYNEHYILGLFGYFFTGCSTPPGPAMVRMDRKDLNSNKTKQNNNEH